MIDRNDEPPDMDQPYIDVDSITMEAYSKIKAQGVWWAMAGALWHIAGSLERIDESFNTYARNRARRAKLGKGRPAG